MSTSFHDKAETKQMVLGPAVEWISIAGLSFLAAQLGRLLWFPSDMVSLWPASGLALVALARSEVRRWPTLLVAFCVGVGVCDMVLHGQALAVEWVFLAANVIAAIVGAVLLTSLNQWFIAPTDSLGGELASQLDDRAVDQRLTLGTWQSVSAFVLGPCVIASGIGAAIIATGTWSMDGHRWAEIFMAWWGAAAVGVLIFGAAGFVVTETVRSDWIPDRNRIVSRGVLATLAVLAVYVFGFQTLPIVYTVIPLFIIMALFGRPIHGAVGLVVLTLIAAWYTTQGVGPFSQTMNNTTACFLLQLYLSVCGASVLAFSGFVRQQHFAQADSQFQLRTIVDSLNAQVFLKDTKNNIIRANRAAADALGRTPEEIAGQHASVFFPDLHLQFEADEAEILSSGKAKTGFLETLTMPDGSVRIVETHKSPFRDQHGNVAGLVTVLNDVTALKQAEGELVSLGRLIEESSSEIFLFSADTLRFIRANRGAVSNLGYTIDELFEMTPLDIKPDHTGETFAKLVEPLESAPDQFIHFETRHQRKDGSIYDASINLQKMRYRDLDVYVAFVTDVSDQKRSAEMVENLFAFSPIAQVLFDDRGIIQCNDAAQQLMRVASKEDLLFRQPGDFSPKYQPCGTESEVKAKPYIEEAYRVGFNRFEWNHLRPDGTEFATDVSIRRVRSERGDALLVIWNDITDRKDYEARLVATHRQLQSSNQELSQFAYIASHDLKAPLRGISSLADFVLEDCRELLPGESVDHLTKMQGRIVRMNRLLDDLLAYGRVGRSHGAMAEHSLRDLTTRAITDCEFPPGISVEVDAEDVRIETLETPLQICLRNLISNAIKHRSDGSGLVRVEAKDQGANVAFTIMDDGDGIRGQHQDRIFRMFETLRARDDVEGSGMGLAFVKKTVETYGGVIELQSPNDLGGTTFSLTWPKKIEI